ncbi:MAG: hypothetical protein H6741_10680 [Alphaproteobacteria bacterium]|nr:hypothetical protein [Alphaproteobacteria bacterium]
MSALQHQQHNQHSPERLQQSPEQQSAPPSVAFNEQPTRQEDGPQPALELELEAQSEDLGEVDSLPTFNQLVGALIDAHTPESGQKRLSVKAQLLFPIKLALKGKIALSLEVTLRREGGNTVLEGSLAFTLGTRIDLPDVDLDAGLTFQGDALASGDHGAECMQLLGLAALPHVESVSDALAGYLYGDTVAYSEDVLANMDTVEEGEEADFAEMAFSAELGVGFDTSDGDLSVAGGLGVGYRHRSGVAAARGPNGEEQLQRTQTGGVTFGAAFEVGDTKAAVGMDASAGTFTLSAETGIQDPKTLSWIKDIQPLVHGLLPEALKALQGAEVDAEAVQSAALDVLARAAEEELNTEALKPVEGAKLHVELLFEHGEPNRAGLRVWLRETESALPGADAKDDDARGSFLKVAVQDIEDSPLIDISPQELK